MRQNLSSALEVAYRFVEICLEKISQSGLRPINASDFDDVFVTRLEKAGLSADLFLGQVNDGILLAAGAGDPDVATGYVYQADVSIMQTILDVGVLVKLSKRLLTPSCRTSMRCRMRTPC